MRSWKNALAYSRPHIDNLRAGRLCQLCQFLLPCTLPVCTLALRSLLPEQSGNDRRQGCTRSHQIQRIPSEGGMFHFRRYVIQLKQKKIKSLSTPPKVALKPWVRGDTRWQVQVLQKQSDLSGFFFFAFFFKTVSTLHCLLFYLQGYSCCCFLTLNMTADTGT